MNKMFKNFVAYVLVFSLLISATAYADETDLVTEDKQNVLQNEQNSQDESAQQSAEDETGTGPVLLEEETRDESQNSDLQKVDFSKWAVAAGGSSFVGENPEISDEGALVYKRANGGDVRVYNTLSPMLADGEVEYIFRLPDVDEDSQGRFGILFRASADNFAMLKFDINKDGQSVWVLESANHWKVKEYEKEFAQKEYNKVKIRYEGKDVKLYINDRFAFDISGEGVNNFPLEAGQIGFRDHRRPKTVDILSIKNGELDSIPTLDLSELDDILAIASDRLASSEYTEEQKQDLASLVEALPNYFETQDEVIIKAREINDAIEALDATPVGASADLQKVAFESWVAIGGKGTFTDENPVLQDDGTLYYKKASNEDIRVKNLESPKLVDGEVEYEFKLSDTTDATGGAGNQGRFGIIYRASDDGKYAMLNFAENVDGNGNWVLETGGSWHVMNGQAPMSMEEYHKLKLRYEGANLKAYLDDREIFDLVATEVGSGTLSSSYPTEAGYIGFREYWKPKGVHIKSIKSGGLDTIPTLDLSELDEVLVVANDKLVSSEYTVEQKQELANLVDTLPNYFGTQEEVANKAREINDAIEALDFVPGELSVDLQKVDFARWVAIGGKGTFTDENPVIEDDGTLYYKKASNEDIRVKNLDSPKLVDGEVEYEFMLSDTNDATGGAGNQGRFGIIYRASDDGKYAMLNFAENVDGMGNWVLETGSSWHVMNGQAPMSMEEYHKLKLRYEGANLKAYLDDREIFNLVATEVGSGTLESSYPTEAGYIGFREYWKPKGVNIKSIKSGELNSIPTLDMVEYDAKLAEAREKFASNKYSEESKVELGEVLDRVKTYYKTQSEVNDMIIDLNKAIAKLEEGAGLEKESLSNDYMTVEVNKNFPQVVSYVLKSMPDEKFYGQKHNLNTLLINDVEVTPVVESQKISDTKINYTLTCEKDDINCVLKATVELKDEEVLWAITEITNNNSEQDSDAKLVRTIAVPHLNIVSVNSNEADATVHGGKIVTNTHSKSGDTTIELNADTTYGDGDFYIAVVNNDKFAASMYTNTDNDTRGGDWNFVQARMTTDEGVKTIGLNSAPWVHQRGLEYRVQDETIAGETELPFIRAKVVADVNGDGKVNWNDGAIAYRDIQAHRKGSENVPNTVATRIAMNFGSQAQNPFLTTLDNVKKVYLHTDGLGQNVLLKGYGSEGHDSGHLNYADIGRRIGGAEDMKILLSEGHKYGAKFGIHVNASETYPESLYFEEDRLRGSAGNYAYGWNWLDQGINIDADYDLRHGRRERFNDLAAALDRGDGKNDLDYVYVDVWGNGQSGDNHSWQSMQLAKEIQSNGWAVAGEWGHAHAPVAILQHWAADVTYGGYANKGINSKLIRFVQNADRDSWTANYVNYSGTAINPLLGGYNMKDFEGWQGRNGYAAYIRNLFHRDVPSKFVQHFDVMTWEDGQAVDLPDVSGWIPDMAISLNNEDLGKLTIERLSNDYAGEEERYRSRVMKLEGKVVLEESASPSMTTDETKVEYLLPWYWDGNGVRLSADDEKLYAFTSSGETRAQGWDLPAGWEDASEVYLYRLTDLGRVDEKVVTVENGKVVLDLLANTAYVVYKTSHPEDRSVEWSNFSHIVDTGFNSRSLEHWTITGASEGNNDDAELRVVDTDTGTQVLKIADNKNEVKLAQKITDLEPNTDYALYVGVENRADEKAFIRVLDGDTLLDSNETNRSIAYNFVSAYTHNTNRQSATILDMNDFGGIGTSYFQNMYVFFTTGDDTSKLKLEIGKEAGTGTTYFDDIRVVKDKQSPYKETDEGRVFTQDFENVAQGFYPFVVSGVEGVTDNRQHLSERHEPYTQRGWDTKVLSDVIEGDWSFKTNGLIGRNNLLFQTIPQNYHFRAGKTYKISFDYLEGTDKAFDFVLGSGKYYPEKTTVYSEALDGTRYNDGDGRGHYEFEFTVPEGENDYWFGIYSSNVAVDKTGIQAKDTNFSGVADFVIDNVRIVEKDFVQRNDEALLAKLAKADEIIANAGHTYTDESIAKLELAMEDARAKLADETLGQTVIDKALENLNKAIDGLVIYEADLSLIEKYIYNANIILNLEKYPEDNKPALREKLAEVNEFLKGDYLPQERVDELAAELLYAINIVRKDVGEVVEKEVTEKLSADKITAISASSEAGYDGGATKDKAVDGKYDNFWHNDWSAGTTVPHWLVLKLDKSREVSKLNYYARYNKPNGAGRISKYKVEVSEDGSTWTDVETKSGGMIPWKPSQLADNPIEFTSPVTGQYFRFTILDSADDRGNLNTSANKLGVLTELEFFVTEVKLSELTELIEVLETTDLKKEIELSGMARKTVSYTKASEASKTAFDAKLAEAKALMDNLYSGTITQEMIDNTLLELRELRLALDGKEEVKESAGGDILPVFVEEEIRNEKLPFANPEAEARYKEIIKNIKSEKDKKLVEKLIKGKLSPKEFVNQVSEETIKQYSESINVYFVDERPDRWYAKELSMLHILGLVQGYEDNTFRYKNNVTGKEFVTLLVRLANKGPEKEDENNWFTPYEKAAKEMGILDKVDFDLSKALTREEVAFLAYEFLEKGEAKVKVSEIKDIEDIDKKYVDAVRYLYSRSILDGYEDGTFKAKNNVRRSEAVAILYRLLND